MLVPWWEDMGPLSTIFPSSLALILRPHFPVFSYPPSGLSLALIPAPTELFAGKLGVG